MNELNRITILTLPDGSLLKVKKHREFMEAGKSEQELTVAALGRISEKRGGVEITGCMVQAEYKFTGVLQRDRITTNEDVFVTVWQNPNPI